MVFVFGGDKMEHNNDYANNKKIEEFNKPYVEKKTMLTLQKLKDMVPHAIISSGLTTDDRQGINMSNSGEILRWVAVRGGIEDWAIYVGRELEENEYIRSFGDKIHDKKNIEKLVPCDDEAFAMYRK